MNCFEKGHKSLQLFKETPEAGLYKNQIGAISSAIAHFSIKAEPALITMPTGTGKTAVMIALSYALKAKKVLVITPSQLVRQQIAESFKNPKVLLDKEIIKGKGILPKVYELTSILSTNEEWMKVLEKHDVVVGIPGTINQTPNLVKTLGSNPFDFIFVDEAHHSRAQTWTNILNAFPKANQILLTATPFRRDNKDIKARLIYHYPLKQAYEDKLFSKINFIPVKTDSLDNEEAKNIEIAKSAENVYNNRKDESHKIIIRTDSKAAADRLFTIYKNNTKLKLQVIHSRLTDKTVAARISELTNGVLDGIICVDMMGEGYDFPVLKIAAVHIPHKSLAITLQFIGRISRTNTVSGDEAFVVGGEHEFKIESHQLYNKDSKDWSIVLPDLHKAKIQKTEDEQDFFDSFEDLTESDELDTIGSEQSSMIEDDDLKPFFHSKLYKVIPKPSSDASLFNVEKKIGFEGLSVIRKSVIRHHHVSSSHDIAVYVVSDLKKPSWYMGKGTLDNINSHLVIIYFDRDNSILFICSTIRETELYEHVANQYLESGILHEIIPLPILKRVMAGWSDAKMFNVGMKSRKIRGNSESYKNILGSRAELGILPGDKYSYTRGHSFGGGYDNILKKDVMLGISTSSKVWTLREEKLKYLVEWFKELARKIGDNEMDKQNSPLSELDSGKVIKEFPEQPIFFSDWDATQYHRLTAVVFLDADDEVVESALICSCNIRITEQHKSLIKFEISKGAANCLIEFGIDPIIDFSYCLNTPHKIALRRGEAAFSDPNVFLSLLKESPLNIFFENMDKLIGKVLFNAKENQNTIDSNRIVAHSWPSNVDVSKEFYSKAELLGKPTYKSIHDYIIDVASAEFDVVFYDHSSLEIADIVGMKPGSIKFYHCKKQDGTEPRCEIDDIYEVCGQAVKSVNWAHRKLLADQLVSRADRNKTIDKLKKGSLEEIKKILATFNNPNLPIEIIIVQPGLKTSNLRTNQQEALKRITTLLSAADNFLQDVSQCKLSVMCS